MEIWQSGSRPPKKGPAEWFTGEVHINPILDAQAPARTFCAAVTFEPKARTAWHTHPLGQTLIVTAGKGLVQTLGEPMREIAVGDVVWIPPHEKHWHGASANLAMTHIAMHEALDGVTVDWLEHVTDAQYSAA